MEEFLVPTQEIVPTHLFERISGEGLGDCVIIGLANSMNIQDDIETAYSYNYNTVLKPIKQTACDIMLRYILL